MVPNKWFQLYFFSIKYDYEVVGVSWMECILIVFLRKLNAETIFDKYRNGQC